MALIKKLLIANRGEIAHRIIRSAQKLAIKTVAVYITAEREAEYVRMADEAIHLEGDALAETFLNIDKMIHIALLSGAQAIHPGYGFLSENPAFAEACVANHLLFIGPGSEVLKLMGNKPIANTLAKRLGLPTLHSQIIKADSEHQVVDDFDFPVIIKASHGGGGKGMELVYNSEELSAQIIKSADKALNYFGDGELFIEQYIPDARHIEVQIMGDNHGNIIHLYERDCTIQRNYQKIIEEAPAPGLNQKLREKLLSDAIQLAKAVHFSGVGTVEFLVDPQGRYYFMEMNPRLQVEHAVTEEITGVDIVREQLLIASGFPLSFSQNQIGITGHAIELRIYAEDPENGFSPSPSPVLSIHLPSSDNVRIESDLNIDSPMINHFDPLILKLIVRENNREIAIHQLTEVMKEINIIGPTSNSQYLNSILTHPEYQNNQLNTSFCKINHTTLIQGYHHQIKVTTQVLCC